MLKTLTPLQKDVLKWCMDQTSSPIMPATNMKHESANQDAIRDAAKELRIIGILSKDNIVTNRGLAYLVVEGNVPFLDIYNAHKQDFVQMEMDIDMKRKILGSDDYYNIFMHYWFRMHIDKDMFHGPPYHQFRVTAHPMEKTKQELDMCLALVEDERIPLDKLLPTFGLPASIVAGAGLTKTSVKTMLTQYRQSM